ncbi:DUF7518 family protein [Natronorarus salvus]|uniref:DUF7518 family protein n=1 Tax=Natronorarus salvus TaxID=3117733 RepID=UPI002F25FEFF
MAKNRVEDLESRVSALEATIRGLTEELVEANERIRVLESHVDVAGAEKRRAAERRAARRSAEVDGAKADGREAEDDESAESAPSDDIIVA